MLRILFMVLVFFCANASALPFAIRQYLDFASVWVFTNNDNKLSLNENINNLPSSVYFIKPLTSDCPMNLESGSGVSVSYGVEFNENFSGSIEIGYRYNKFDSAIMIPSSATLMTHSGLMMLNAYYNHVLYNHVLGDILDFTVGVGIGSVFLHGHGEYSIIGELFIDSSLPPHNEIPPHNEMFGVMGSYSDLDGRAVAYQFRANVGMMLSSVFMSYIGYQFFGSSLIDIDHVKIVGCSFIGDTNIGCRGDLSVGNTKIGNHSIETGIRYYL